MRPRAIPRGLILSLSLALVGLVVPSAASADTHDLVVTIDNVSSPSARVRSARITLENTGPDDFDGCHPSADDCYQYGQGNAHIGISFEAQPDGAGTADVTTSVPCERKSGNAAPPGQMVCKFGEDLPAGQSVSVDVAFKAGKSGGAKDLLTAGVDAAEYFGEDPVAEDDINNNGDYYVWGDAGSCELQAKGPQKAAKALVVTVFGSTTGCVAKLTSAKLKIGNKVYVFIKKKPSKNVGAGEKWKVSIPINGQALEKVKDALKANKNVKAKAEFDLGDRTDSIVVKIK